jgi:phosphatidate cytidylyltransferase
MHLKRIISALAVLPLLFAVIYMGGVVFAVFIALICMVALWEYYRIVFNITGESVFGVFPFTGYLSIPFIVWAAYLESFYIITGIILLNMIIAGILAVFLFKSNPIVSDTVSKHLLGLIYIPVLLSLVVVIRSGDDGFCWIFFILFMVFPGDIGAYYIGSLFGKHKLCPAVSPGKTIEGAIGGFAVSFAAACLFRFFYLPELPLIPCLILVVLIGVAGPFGDLFESILKRRGNIKDSGGIMPGHGGILDRIDALLFAIPIAAYFKAYVFI